MTQKIPIMENIFDQMREEKPRSHLSGILQYKGNTLSTRPMDTSSNATPILSDKNATVGVGSRKRIGQVLAQ